MAFILIAGSETDEIKSPEFALTAAGWLNTTSPIGTLPAGLLFTFFCQPRVAPFRD